jgi:transcriptional regulator with XRE-family HTH domain
MSAKEMFTTRDFSTNEERIFAREELVFNVTEDLLVIMEDLNITKAQLAKKLGKSKSFVTQVLSGSRNMTLGSFSDICFALGFKPTVKVPVEPARLDGEWNSVEAQTSSNKKMKTTVKHLKLVHDAEWRTAA